jgi:hypothetical protein
LAATVTIARANVANEESEARCTLAFKFFNIVFIVIPPFEVDYKTKKRKIGARCQDL